MSTNNELINSFQEYITKLSPLLYDIINEINHNTFFLFTITTIISLIVLYRLLLNILLKHKNNIR